ncbi:MAG: PaaI family thioesterase [Alphaproteobacteria bacterium]|nr:PaaI family thioesterase [Alphaproteobacteria bacterium]
MAKKKMTQAELRDPITLAPYHKWLGGPIPTVDLGVDYHRPALQGALTVEARVIKLGRTISAAEAFVYDSDGALLASGRGVYHSPPAS